MALIFTESQNQIQLFKWAKNHPIAKDYLISIPNGMRTNNVIQARNAKLQGLRPGVSDIFLAFPVKGGLWGGLWIELKRDKSCKPSLVQRIWIARMKKIGYRAVVAYGWVQAVKEIKQYLGEPSQDLSS